jgi:hypothetical protein
MWIITETQRLRHHRAEKNKIRSTIWRPVAVATRFGNISEKGASAGGYVPADDSLRRSCVT